MKRRVRVIAAMLLMLPVLAMADVPNREMQLAGGVVVSSATDAFFFAPTQTESTGQWGLYALSSGAPVGVLGSAFPSRLIHADAQSVYYMTYTDQTYTANDLWRMDLQTGVEESLLSGIGDVFVMANHEFLYVAADDPYALRSYDVEKQSGKVIKDMASSDRKIVDAFRYEGDIYFLAAKDGREDAYQYHASSGKATNLKEPVPAPVKSVLYEGYRLYSGDGVGNAIYAVEIDAIRGTRLGEGYPVSLNSYRFGSSIYLYDVLENLLVRIPLSGLPPTSLKLQAEGISSLVLGGSSQELLLLSPDGVYAIAPDLTSQQLLFSFNMYMTDHIWSHIVPAGDAGVLVMGYSEETIQQAGVLPPTAVYAMDRASGEVKFGYPQTDPVVITQPDPGQEGEMVFGERLAEFVKIIPDDEIEAYMAENPTPEPAENGILSAEMTLPELNAGATALPEGADGEDTHSNFLQGLVQSGTPQGAQATEAPALPPAGTGGDDTSSNFLQGLMTGGNPPEAEPAAAVTSTPAPAAPSPTPPPSSDAAAGSNDTHFDFSAFGGG